MKNYTAPIFKPIKLNTGTISLGPCRYKGIDEPVKDPLLGNIFGIGVNGCDTPMEPCYEVPEGDFNIYAS